MLQLAHGRLPRQTYDTGARRIIVRAAGISDAAAIEGAAVYSSKRSALGISTELGCRQNLKSSGRRGLSRRMARSHHTRGNIFMRTRGPVRHLS